MTTITFEARCPRYKETFIPESPDDLRHEVKEDGSLCETRAQFYLEIHSDGRRFEIHTSPTALQERLLDRAVASVKARKSMPPIKFRPILVNSSSKRPGITISPDRVPPPR